MQSKYHMWRTPLALALAIPTGLIAGKWVFASGMGGLFILLLLSVVGPFALGMLSTRHHVIIGISFCMMMCLQTVLSGEAFQDRIGYSGSALDRIVPIAVLLGLSILFSLFVTIPMRLIRKQSDKFSMSPDRTPNERQNPADRKYE